MLSKSIFNITDKEAHLHKELWPIFYSLCSSAKLQCSASFEQKAGTGTSWEPEAPGYQAKTEQIQNCVMMLCRSRLLRYLETMQTLGHHGSVVVCTTCSQVSQVWATGWLNLLWHCGPGEGLYLHVHSQRRRKWVPGRIGKASACLNSFQCHAGCRGCVLPGELRWLVNEQVLWPGCLCVWPGDWCFVKDTRPQLPTFALTLGSTFRSETTWDSTSGPCCINCTQRHWHHLHHSGRIMQKTKWYRRNNTTFNKAVSNKTPLLTCILPIKRKQKGRGKD